MGILTANIGAMWEEIKKREELIKASGKETAEAELKLEYEQLKFQIEQEAHIESERLRRDLQKTLVDLQEAQEQLVTSEKMAMLGSLVAGIAHEINTPIGIGVTAASCISVNPRP